MIIAQISDLHVRGFRGAFPWSFLGKRLLGGMNLALRRAHEFPTVVLETLIHDLNQQAPDHILISGDLGNLSFVGEFTRARRYIDRLRLSPSEISIIPGNHDCYTREAQQAGDFERIFAPFMTGDLTLDRPRIYPFVRLRGEVAIIALSTAVPCGPTEALGTLGSEQCAALARALSHDETRKRFRLVMLHHPPRVLEKDWHKRLTDGEAFCEVIAHHGAELIVHGHLHRQLESEIAGPNGPVPVVGVNASTWLSPDAGRSASYTLYHIENKRIAKREVRRFDSANQLWCAIN